MFIYQAPVRIHDADAAGVLFFGRYFTLAHDAYEAFLESKGFGAGRIFRQEKFLIPVVHAEADYKNPLWVGDLATVRLRVDEVRSRSFSISYEIYTPSNTLACRVRTVHVVVDTEKKRATTLPEELRRVLETEVAIGSGDV
ncbi:MAG TPA: thioesterase family protein [Candidatus Hydrogenedentes bacterium]|nr:thioesterase family protein [Candidatus Hydrogenedentota bacterium]HOL76061.1 thioesterase family protein [Candidatus Hydrogenedentota bacterium]HPO84675.1 thioesterase family protein [Candidatus Hydrogenedentota bacterium]